MVENGLVKPTGFDKLVLDINKEHKLKRDRELQESEKKRKFLDHKCKTEGPIISAYYFLVTQVKMPKRPITPKEFKTVSEKLREMAIQNTSSFWYRFFYPWKTKCWRFYIQHGRFNIYWNVYSKSWRGSNPFDFFGRSQVEHSQYGDYPVPDNLDELSKQLEAGEME